MYRLPFSDLDLVSDLAFGVHGDNGKASGTGVPGTLLDCSKVI
jgi:hypothetical protein